MINLSLVWRRLRAVSERRTTASKLRTLARLGLIGLGIMAGHAAAMVGIEGMGW